MNSTRSLAAVLAEADKPLPPPWHGPIDASREEFYTAVGLLINTEPQLALAVCRKAFAQAETRGENNAAVYALLRMFAVLQNTAMDSSLKDHVWALVAQRADKVVDPVLAVRLELVDLVRLVDRGENALVLSRGHGALAKAMAIGRGPLVLGALCPVALALRRIGEPDLALDLYEQMHPLLRKGDSLAACTRADHFNNKAMAYLHLADMRGCAGDESAARAALQNAREHVEQACALILPLNNDRMKVALLDTSTQILLRSGEVAAARAQAEHVQSVLAATPTPGTEVWGLLHLALVQIDLHEGRDLHQALSTLQAIARVQSGNFQGGSAYRTVQSALARVHERLGQHEQSLACHKRLTDWQSQAHTAMTRERVKMMRHTLLAMRTEAVEFITHDLRTPLAAARTWLHTVADDRLPASSRTALREAELQLRDAFDLSELYLSVLRAEFLPASALQRLDLGALTDDLCESLSPPIASRIVLTRDTEIGVDVIGNARLLTRALTALLNHAFARAPADTAVNVRVARAQGGPVGEVQLSVADRGDNLSLQTRMRLYQCHAPGTAQGVNPLGLVARVARLHQARIRIDSPPAGGSTVTLCFKPAR
jgi:signal transduction histidine kinase